MRHALHAGGLLRQRLLLRRDEFEPLANPIAGVKPRNPPGNDARNARRRQLARRRQQPFATRHAIAPLPLAGLVIFADDPRADILAPVIELLLQLVFNDLALLLYHQHLLQPLGEVTHPHRIERPGHADLEQPDADRSRPRLVDAQPVQRLDP